MKAIFELERAEITTFEELLTNIELMVADVNTMGGHKALSDYGQGEYDMALRFLSKGRDILANQKASEDA